MSKGYLKIRKGILSLELIGAFLCSVEGRAVPTLLITLIAPALRGLRAGNTALKANANHRRSWLGGCEGGLAPLQPQIVRRNPRMDYSQKGLVLIAALPSLRK